MPSALPEDGAPSASLGHLEAQAALAHPGAPPEPLGGLRWPPQLAPARSQGCGWSAPFQAGRRVRTRTRVRKGRRWKKCLGASKSCRPAEYHPQYSPTTSVEASNRDPSAFVPARLPSLLRPSPVPPPPPPPYPPSSPASSPPPRRFSPPLRFCPAGAARFHRRQGHRWKWPSAPPEDGAPPAPWTIRRPRPLLSTPERRLGSLEAHRGLRSSPQAGPKLRIVFAVTPYRGGGEGAGAGPTRGGGGGHGGGGARCLPRPISLDCSPRRCRSLSRGPPGFPCRPLD